MLAVLGIVAAFVAVSLVTVPEPAEGHAGSYYASQVATSTLNVRSGPSTGYPVLGTVSSGDQFVRVGSSGSWEEIFWQGRTAWVHGGYTSEVYNGVVTRISTSTLNVRSGPSTGYGIIGQVHNGEAYIVRDSSDSRSGGYNGIEYIWHKIQFDDRTGWVYDAYTNEGSVRGKLEANFAETELHSTRSACTRFHISKDLTSRLQHLRNTVGAIGLSNGYRCPSHNADVGGSGTSYHISGQAADITYCGGYSFSSCAYYARNVGLDALNEGDHLHVSVPQGGGV